MDQQAESKYLSIETCAQCGGRFPGPGVGWRGSVFCCDQCATAYVEKPRGAGRWMLTRLLPVAALAMGGWGVMRLFPTATRRAGLMALVGASSAAWSRLSGRGTAERLGSLWQRTPRLAGGMRAVNLRDFARAVRAA